MPGRVAPDAPRAERFVAPARRAAALDREEDGRIVEDEARRRGFEAGQAAGRADALRESEERLAELAASISALATLHAQIVRAAEVDLLTLALRLAEAVVRDKISADDGVAARALGAALAEVPGAQSFTVRCHPDDESSIAAALTGAAGVHQLRSDPTLRRGGCVVESSAGDIDVRIETQLRILEHELLSRS